MRNYWYVSLSNRYPQPSTNDPPRIVQSIQMKSKYSIVEMTREATPQEIDQYKLVLIGIGWFNDKHIQENIKRWLR
ncbi:hypothetical protein PNC69_10820 [Enterococcus faecium]|uniref:hypothetical protein n=1 Tax=Enterococcus faecium TaxID=1352 RepID=UPI0018977758|nr:hypothetical protein [Enterococcus faecium]MDB7686131.1 hypothetical protein [Enterococcus faecium]